MADQSDDSTIRNLKLVPLPELTDKEAVEAIILDSLKDVGTRTVMFGNPPEPVMNEVHDLVGLCLTHGLWIRRVRLGAPSREQRRKLRKLGLVAFPLLSITFQSVEGHEYNVSYGPHPKQLQSKELVFVLVEYIGILYETDEIIRYGPAKTLYEGKSRSRVKTAIRKLGKPGMQAVLMD